MGQFAHQSTGPHHRRIRITRAPAGRPVAERRARHPEARAPAGRVPPERAHERRARPRPVGRAQLRDGEQPADQRVDPGVRRVRDDPERVAGPAERLDVQLEHRDPACRRSARAGQRPGAGAAPPRGRGSRPAPAARSARRRRHRGRPRRLRGGRVREPTTRSAHSGRERMPSPAARPGRGWAAATADHHHVRDHAPDPRQRRPPGATGFPPTAAPRRHARPPATTPSAPTSETAAVTRAARFQPSTSAAAVSASRRRSDHRHDGHAERGPEVARGVVRAAAEPALPGRDAGHALATERGVEHAAADAGHQQPGHEPAGAAARCRCATASAGPTPISDERAGHPGAPGPALRAAAGPPAR